MKTSLTTLNFDMFIEKETEVKNIALQQIGNKL